MEKETKTKSFDFKTEWYTNDDKFYCDFAEEYMDACLAMRLIESGEVKPTVAQNNAVHMVIRSLFRLFSKLTNNHDDYNDHRVEYIDGTFYLLDTHNIVYYEWKIPWEDEVYWVKTTYFS